LRIQQKCCDCAHRDEDRFCNLEDADLRLFESLKIPRVYPKGTRIFIEGQPAAGVYVLCQGRVKLSTCSPDGKIIILGIAGPGDVLGLSSVVSDVEYEATAEVVDICQVNFISKSDFLKYIQHHPGACLSAAKQLGRSYQAAHQMVCSLGLSDSVFVKLGKLFLGWTTSGNDGNGTIRLKNSFTHEEIAEMIGTTRETVTRSLREMRERGLVTLKGSDLTIHDKAMLCSAVGFHVDHL
jgi:CRP/FNR family transcriptional regulator